MKIKIDTNLDKKLQEELERRFCDKCDIPCEPGCCCGCTIELDIEFLKEPTKFITKEKGQKKPECQKQSNCSYNFQEDCTEGCNIIKAIEEEGVDEK